MSVVFDTDSSDLLFASANLTPAVSTRCGWTKFTAMGVLGSGGDLTYLSDNGPSNQLGLIFPAGPPSAIFQLVNVPAGNSAFGSAPSTSGWFFWAVTNAGTGAGNLIGYWQNNAGGGFVTVTQSGLAFTPTTLVVAQVGSATCSAEFAYYMEFDGVLTPTQLAAQFLSATPLTTARRYISMATAATAGHDASGNGFDMTVSGTLTDGASLPTFPITSHLLPTLSNQGGF